MRRNLYRQGKRNWNEGSKPSGPGALDVREDDEEALLFTEGADLGTMVRAIRARLPLILLIVLIGGALGALLAMSLKSSYTSTAIVQLDPRQRDVTDVAAVVTELPATDMVLDTEVEALKSATLHLRVIDQLDLDEDTEFNAFLKYQREKVDGPQDEGPLQAVMRMVRGNVNEKWEESPPTEEEQLRMVHEAFREAVTVERVGLTSVIAVECTSRDPRKAQRICNALTETYVASQVETKVEETEQADEWLERRIAELREELNEKEQAIEQFRVSNEVVGEDRETLTQQQLAQLNLQLAMTNVELAEKRARLRQARSMRNARNGTQSIAEVLGSEAIIQLREKQAEAIRRRADLATRYRPTHPDMQRVERELAEISSQIELEIDRIMTNLENEVEVAAERVQSLEESIESRSEDLQGTALTFARLKELEQDAEATREIYRSFLSRAKGLADQASIQKADSRVLSPAQLPTEPSAPNRPLIVAMALLLSGLVGAGSALAMEFADQRIRTPEMAQRATGLPHLGSIPLVTTRRYKGRPHRDLLDQGTSIFSESFEELFTRVQSSNAVRPPRTILFTSATAAEGKTTSALCFALAAARSGKKVVLLEGDLRCPTVYDVVAIEGVQVEDLKAVLDGELDWEEIAWTEPQTGLRILPVKSPSDDPVSHLSSGRLAELLEELRAEFDMVVIDTAPVIPVSDALKLMPYADKVIFVTRWRRTLRTEAETAVRKIRDVGGDIAGTILTFVDRRRRWRFGSAGLPNSRKGNRRYYGRNS